MTSAYSEYIDSSILSASPVRLIQALYEGALDSVRHAEGFLATGDAFARGAAINRAFAIINELLVSLNYEQGGELAIQLRDLYGYIQNTLLTAHAGQSPEKLAEVKRLLTTLSEGWQGISETQTGTSGPAEQERPSELTCPGAYAPYESQIAASYGALAYSY